MTIKSAEEFVRLRTSDDPAEYGRAAHEEARETVWLDVIRRFPAMRAWVAHNKTVPLPVLTVLASDESDSVRAEVAMKRKLTADLFDALANDPSPAVRERIACNAKAPRAVLDLLARDPVAFVAAAATERSG